MRITADINIINLLLPSANMRSKSRSSKGQVSVGKKPGSVASKDLETYLMVCTKQNPSGRYFKLRGNIDKCFAKNACEGKATIRFKEPPTDLALDRVDPIQLKAFLGVVCQAFHGKELNQKSLSPLGPATSSQMDRLQTRLVIVDKKDYPVTTNFPPYVESLTISLLAMKRVDSRICKLRHLKILNLSDNQISILPESLNSLDQLAELKLCKNMLKEFPDSLCTGCFQRSLKLLDLSRNCISDLSLAFCSLTALVTLKLDHNNLICLPSRLWKMKQLRYFSASGNQLKALPATFKRLTLNSLDLFNNPFKRPSRRMLIDKLEVPSLFEWAARCIRNRRVPFTEEDVGHLKEFLSCGHVCILCHRYCFRFYGHYLAELDLRNIAASYTNVPANGAYVTIEAFVCSRQCQTLYRERRPFNCLVDGIY